MNPGVPNFQGSEVVKSVYLLLSCECYYLSLETRRPNRCTFHFRPNPYNVNSIVRRCVQILGVRYTGAILFLATKNITVVHISTLTRHFSPELCVQNKRCPEKSQQHLRFSEHMCMLNRHECETFNSYFYSADRCCIYSSVIVAGLIVFSCY